MSVELALLSHRKLHVKRQQRKKTTEDEDGSFLAGLHGLLGIRGGSRGCSTATPVDRPGGSLGHGNGGGGCIIPNDHTGLQGMRQRLDGAVAQGTHLAIPLGDGRRGQQGAGAGHGDGDGVEDGLLGLGGPVNELLQDGDLGNGQSQAKTSHDHLLLRVGVVVGVGVGGRGFHDIDVLLGLVLVFD